MSWIDFLKKFVKGKPEERGKEKQRVAEKAIAPQHRARPYSGEETQFRAVDDQSPHKQLVIGLDFGTAFTKVVVGEDRIRYAVPLNGPGEQTNDYLLPSALSISHDGECALPTKDEHQYSELKIRLIDGDLSDEALAHAAAYLALVLRLVRRFILNTKSDVYGGNYIDWLVNVGLPTDSFHNNNLATAYRKVVGVAWWASTVGGSVTINNSTDGSRGEGWTSKERDRTIHPDAISVFPEFVAQITGYVRSPLRQSDLHLLIDVGAGTVDSTVFNVHEEDDEDRFPIFAKAVRPFGTRFLVKHRLKGTTVLEAGELGPFEPIPKKQRFAELLGMKSSALTKKDQSFRGAVLKSVTGLMGYTKRRRYPMSRRWQTGVPTFLCGGGAKCDFYREALLKEKQLGGIPLQPMQLPKPDSLDSGGLGANEYDRISVAYGLAFDPFDIGEIIREDEIEDVSGEDGEQNQGGGAISKDGFTCPKCGGTGGLHTTCGRCGGSGFVH